ncbi:hypothetical protein Q5H91_08020 [Sphingomonas sp. KR1UV-12]|uniref:Uncharacterized protein n=1 Tax=Sphingomonas aurea TaxID=3063994 RepID=A0ABT9EJN7_9SPHN|nr:hypothetical protein [Sphingomonas sp. KR1UV-12]MDP1027154.1 hypothetical protein [Sphingomonas sp. KR1UV-12]
MPLTLLIAATLAQAAAPAARLTPEQADARCVVILGFINQQPNQTPQRIEAVRTGTAYYMGKLRGRNPRIALAPTLDAAAQLAQAQKVNVGTESQRCGQELTDIAASQKPAAPTPRKP